MPRICRGKAAVREQFHAAAIGARIDEYPATQGAVIPAAQPMVIGAPRRPVRGRFG